jgi:hypothetical protein
LWTTRHKHIGLLFERAPVFERIERYAPPERPSFTRTPRLYFFSVALVVHLLLL